ncbi:MAG: RadC family protein [Planctomycetota bacterium]|jgi:DNA repair protein RadC
MTRNGRERQSSDLRAKPHSSIYNALRDHWQAAEPALLGAAEESAQYDSPEIVRFFRRIGSVPKTWPAGRAADAAREAVEQMAAATRSTPAEVCGVLMEFCADEGPLALCSLQPRCAECPVDDYCDYPSRRPTIKDLPETERPRERLLQGGEESLSDVELLGIIIRDGWRKATALELAGRLLSEFGSFRRLASCTVAELTQVGGIGPAKAAQIKAALAIARRYASQKMPAGTEITGSEQLFRYMREKLYGLKKEHFYALMLDTKHRIIREDRVAVGSLSESIVHPREVFKPAIRESAAKVIFAHNHPSGNPEPSPQDRRLTARLVEAGRLVGIPVLDHLIVGDETYYSFAEHGLLTWQEPAAPSPPPHE